MTVNRILLTGAAGGIGQMLRRDAAHLCKHFRLTDKVDLGEARANEEIFIGDLSDAAFCEEITHDVDFVMHFGGKSIEGTWDAIRDSNIDGHYKLYEGCRKNGVTRIAWGSSNHAIGFYDRTTVLSSDCMTRPDSNYAVSKVFGEALAQYYWDMYAIETLSVRIGSCFAKPLNLRMLATWISQPDFVHLMERAILAPAVGHTVIYGQSNNTEKLWDNRLAAHIGFNPKDDAELYRAEVEDAAKSLDRFDAAMTKHGGAFVSAGHFED